METTRRWLRIAAERVKGTFGTANVLAESAILTLDIGGSTRYLASIEDGQEAAMLLENLIDRLCKCVLKSGGSVMSYTGDGFIAIFETRHFSENHRATASAAYEAAKGALDELQKWQADSAKSGGQKLTGRAALHWGSVYIPSSGELYNQVLGVDVVIATRLCDWLSHIIEEAVPPGERQSLLGATEDFAKRHEASEWRYWGEPPFKGVGAKVEVSLAVRPSDPADLALSEGIPTN
jgi:class 3 adenylate cyclase